MSNDAQKAMFAEIVESTELMIWAGHLTREQAVDALRQVIRYLETRGAKGDTTTGTTSGA